jgi:hypothetical protein
VVGVGGGSLIDGVKGSVTLACLGGTCEDYFGVGQVSLGVCVALGEFPQRLGPLEEVPGRTLRVDSGRHEARGPAASS